MNISLDSCLRGSHCSIGSFQWTNARFFIGKEAQIVFFLFLLDSPPKIMDLPTHQQSPFFVIRFMIFPPISLQYHLAMGGGLNQQTRGLHLTKPTNMGDLSRFEPRLRCFTKQHGSFFPFFPFFPFSVDKLLPKFP